MPNPFAGSRGYAKLSNRLVVPLFRLLPVPRGFALLTVTGRRSGRPRRRPVRAVRRGDTLYCVAMLGARSDWLRNVRAAPRVGVKLGGRQHRGAAREIADAAETATALAAYVEDVFPADYADYGSYHWGWPTPRKIREAHRRWAAAGVLVAVDLEAPD